MACALLCAMHRPPTQGSRELRHAGPLSAVGPAAPSAPHVKPTCTAVSAHPCTCTLAHSQAPLAERRWAWADRKEGAPHQGRSCPGTNLTCPFLQNSEEEGAGHPAGAVNVSSHWYPGSPTLQGEGPNRGRLWGGRGGLDGGHPRTLCGVSPGPGCLWGPFAQPLRDADVSTQLPLPFPPPSEVWGQWRGHRHSR